MRACGTKFSDTNFRPDTDTTDSLGYMSGKYENGQFS